MRLVDCSDVYDSQSSKSEKVQGLSAFVKCRLQAEPTQLVVAPPIPSNPPPLASLPSIRQNTLNTCPSFPSRSAGPSLHYHPHSEPHPSSPTVVFKRVGQALSLGKAHVQEEEHEQMSAKPDLHIDVDAAQGQAEDEHEFDGEDDDMYSDESSVSPLERRAGGEEARGAS